MVYDKSLLMLLTSRKKINLPLIRGGKVASKQNYCLGMGICSWAGYCHSSM